LGNFSRFMLYWASTALALWVVDGLFDSLEFESLQALALSALVLAIVNLTIKPVLLLVTLPLTILSLGLAIPLINGLVLVLVSELIPGFAVSGFWMGVVCALAVSLVSFLIGIATGQSRVHGNVYKSIKVRGSSAADPTIVDVQAREKPSDKDKMG
jgi:putative membrane protein